MSNYADTVDVADLWRAMRRGWREIIAFTALGTLAGLAVLPYAPHKFDGVASAVVRSVDAQSSLLSRLGDTKTGAGAGLLGNVTPMPLETELQILASRAVAGAVVDSLLLQARVRSPA